MIPFIYQVATKMHGSVQTDLLYEKGPLVAEIGG